MEFREIKFGLKDTNGTDIYEGDIVEIAYRTFGEVVFKNGEYFIKTKRKAPSKLLDDGDGYERQYWSIEKIRFRNMSLSKVGNVFDNPELLSIP